MRLLKTLALTTLSSVAALAQNGQITDVVNPEPSAFILVGGGLLAAGILANRRRNKK